MYQCNVTNFKVLGNTPVAAANGNSAYPIGIISAYPPYNSNINVANIVNL